MSELERYNEAWKACWLPDKLTFEDWANHVFDHPILKPEWYHQHPESGFLQLWKETAFPAVTLGYMARLFSSPEFLIPRFSRAQIDQGLYYLISSGCSEHFLLLRNETIPWPGRRACFDAMIHFYAKLIAPVYGNDIVHYDQEPGDRISPTSLATCGGTSFLSPQRWSIQTVTE